MNVQFEAMRDRDSQKAEDGNRKFIEGLKCIAGLEIESNLHPRTWQTLVWRDIRITLPSMNEGLNLMNKINLLIDKRKRRKPDKHWINTPSFDSDFHEVEFAVISEYSKHKTKIATVDAIAIKTVL